MNGWNIGEEHRRYTTVCLGREGEMCKEEPSRRDSGIHVGSER